MNRSTCQKCGKKRYQDRMKMINPKSLKNGKPEWACLDCIDPKYIQVSAEPILFPNSARHFNGVLMEGTNCGHCHMAGAHLCCDECREQILSLDGYSKQISEIEIQKNKIEIAKKHIEFYTKNPLKLHHDWKRRHDLQLNSIEIKIKVLEERIQDISIDNSREYSDYFEHTFIYSSIRVGFYKNNWTYSTRQVYGAAGGGEPFPLEREDRQFSTKKQAVLAACKYLKSKMLQYLNHKDSVKQNYNQRTIKSTIEAIDMFLKLKNFDNI